MISLLRATYAVWQQRKGNLSTGKTKPGNQRGGVTTAQADTTPTKMTERASTR
jgi:hypothetical protein